MGDVDAQGVAVLVGPRAYRYGGFAWGAGGQHHVDGRCCCNAVHGFAVQDGKGLLDSTDVGSVLPNHSPVFDNVARIGVDHAAVVGDVPGIAVDQPPVLGDV